MSFASAISWMRGKLYERSRNEVVPIQIIVEPRRKKLDLVEKRKTCSIVSDSSSENDLQLVRRWNTMDSNITSVAANGIIGNLGPFEDEAEEIIEMMPVVSTPAVSELENLQEKIKSAVGRSSVRIEQGSQSSLLVCTSDVNTESENIARIVRTKNKIRNRKRQHKPSTYIHMYMTLMYIFGTSAFGTREKTPLNGWKKCMQYMVSKLQLVVFVLVVSLSAFQPFCQAKYNMLWFLFKGGFNRFVRFSFNVTCFATSLFGAFTLCRKWNSVNRMIRLMSSYEKTWATATKRTVFCVPLAIFTVIIAVLKSLLIIDIDDFSVEDALLESSSQMGEDLFIWSSNCLNETMNQNNEDFGTDVNAMTLILALVKIVRDFAFHLQHGMLWDLIGIVVITLHCWMSFFMTFVKEVVENVLDENSEEWRTLQSKREIVWKMYREIRAVFEAVNDVFSPLLLLFHVTNVLRYAFFMEHCIYPSGIYAFSYFNLLLNILKSEIIYIIASNIAQKNLVLRKCLRNWGSRTGNVDVGYTQIDLTAVLDELDLEPLGLGQGHFVIHQGFHFGLFGLVSSLFVMLASKKP